MTWNDILDEIIVILQPEHVPVEFIIMAKALDVHGIEHVIRGTELVQFMARPEKSRMREARVILDIRKIRRVMRNEVVRFFRNLDEKLNND